MDGDERLYGAMVWALAIGIVIVIVTLLLTRPAAESFTELYFENHTLLPEYSRGESHDYYFTLHNLENGNRTYNYTITQEYYSLDYACQPAELYLEDENNTRVTHASDAAFIIKDAQYNISFSYTIYSGKGKVILRLTSEDSRPVHELMLDHERGVLFLDGKYVMMINDSASHSVRLSVAQNSTIITLDGDATLLAPLKDYSGVILQLETMDNYAEITSLAIERPAARQYVNVHIAGANYLTWTLNRTEGPGIIIQYSKFLAANPIYEKIFERPMIQAAYVPQNVTYYSKDAINVSGYTLKASFRTAAPITIGLKGVLELIYYNGTVAVGGRVYHTTPLTSISMAFSNDSAAIIVGNNTITTIGNLDLANVVPMVVADSNAQLTEFSVKSSYTPTTIQYTISTARTQTSYAGIYTPKVFNSIVGELNTTGNASDGRVDDFYAREGVNATRYRLSVSYQDRSRKQPFRLTMQGLDQLHYDFAFANNTATFGYLKNASWQQSKLNITPRFTNRLVIDAVNNTVLVSFNDWQVFAGQLDNTSGILLFDYGNITLTNAQLQDRDSSTTRIYRKQAAQCIPELMNSTSSTWSITLGDKQYKTFHEKAYFNTTFDIAKTIVSLDNGEEIHFITKLI